MKKAIAIILAIAITASFAACGNRSNYQNKETDNSTISSEQFTDNTDTGKESSTDKVGDTESESGNSSENKTDYTDYHSSNATGGKDNIPNSTDKSENNTNNNSSANKPTKPTDGNNGGSSNPNIPDNGNNGNADNNKPTEKPTSPEKPSKPETPTAPEPHKHNFTDVGVVPMDWTYANVDPNYDGPTNTHEKVSAANACVKCGYWFGSGSYFEDHYYDHIWNPNASNDCPGGYSLRTVYACYHLLECSCGAYRRGKLAYYEYYMYFNGNGNPPTHIKLKDWQIKELNLPMP